MFCKKCGSEIADDSVFCYKCGEKLGDIPTESLTAKRINLNPDKLDTSGTAEYLKIVCQLENDKYTLVKTKQNLEYKVNNYGYAKNISKPLKEKSNFDFDDYLFLVLIGGFLGYIFGAMSTHSGGIISGIIVGLIYISTWIGMGIGIGAALLIIMFIGIYYSILTSKENKINRKKYHKEVNEDNLRVEKEKACIPVFKRHIAELDKKIAMLDNSLNKLYSYDILYKKYRGNLAALNTMCEYFVSGRAVTLSTTNGNDGAYNLYENELRQNVIIDKLDVVINSLEQIKANQYALYEAIQEADRTMYQISDMAEKISSIADNSALSACNSKIAADNTKAIAYMETINLV